MIILHVHVCGTIIWDPLYMYYMYCDFVSHLLDIHVHVCTCIMGLLMNTKKDDSIKVHIT